MEYETAFRWVGWREWDFSACGGWGLVEAVSQGGGVSLRAEVGRWGATATWNTASVHGAGGLEVLFKGPGKWSGRVRCWEDAWRPT